MPPIKNRFGKVTDANAADALAKLIKLEKTLGEGECVRINALAIAESRMSAFGAAYKVTLAKSSHCIQRLLGKSCAVNRHKICDCRPPGDDHGDLWMKDGKPHLWVSQPYKIGGNTLLKSLEFAKANNLEIDISAEASYYYPGRTFAIIYRQIA